MTSESYPEELAKLHGPKPDTEAKTEQNCSLRRGLWMFRLAALTRHVRDKRISADLSLLPVVRRRRSMETVVAAIAVIMITKWYYFL